MSINKYQFTKNNKINHEVKEELLFIIFYAVELFSVALFNLVVYNSDFWNGLINLRARFSFYSFL